jgi:hypothetical protein
MRDSTGAGSSCENQNFFYVSSVLIRCFKKVAVKRAFFKVNCWSSSEVRHPVFLDGT